MEPGTADSRQRVQIHQLWPKTAKCLEATYFTNPDWSRTDAMGHNACGYLLWSLTNFRNKVLQVHAHLEYTDAELDQAAMHEISYQWQRGRQFRNPPAGLAACILNLPTERPEKLMQARRTLAGRPGALGKAIRPGSPELLTEILSSSSGQTTQHPEVCPTGSALQDLTPPSSFHDHSQAERQPGSIYSRSAQAPFSGRYPPMPGRTATAG